jgi:hypothetical protein
MTTLREPSRDSRRRLPLDATVEPAVLERQGLVRSPSGDGGDLV